jgi:hypothetical protein
MMLSCRETTRLMSQGLDRDLGFAERLALRVHLAYCLGCRRAGRQMRFLRRAVRGLVEIDIRTNY